MKNILSIVSMVLVLGAMSQEVSIDVAESTIQWTGSKVVGNDHKGTLAFKDGSLKMKNGALSGGSFTVDMTSLANTDLSGGMKSKLEGHLKSDDFFGVETYPTAALEFKKVKKSGSKYVVTADLTIKGQTESISFDANLTKADGWVVGEAEVKFDRSKFDVRYGSNSFFDNLGNKAIDNEIVLNVTIKAKA